LNPQDHILNQCINEANLLNYLSGNCDAVTKRSIELHISDCDLCSDAIEGLMTLSTSEINDALTRINLPERINAPLKSNRRIVWWTLAAAASVLLFVAISKSVIKNDEPDKNLVINTPPQKELPANNSEPKIEINDTLRELIKKENVINGDSINRNRPVQKPKVPLVKEEIKTVQIAEQEPNKSGEANQNPPVTQEAIAIKV
jgi:hypothetical protein